MFRMTKKAVKQINRLFCDMNLQKEETALRIEYENQDCSLSFENIKDDPVLGLKRVEGFFIIMNEVSNAFLNGYILDYGIDEASHQPCFYFKDSITLEGFQNIQN